MVEPQNLVPNLSEIMEEYATIEEEVQLEPQIETTPVVELEGREEEQNPAHKGKKHKRAKQSRAEQAKAPEDDKAFISNEAYSLWEKNLSDKGFIVERGFGKFISPFTEIIEKRGWSLFCMHKPPRFAA